MERGWACYKDFMQYRCMFPKCEYLTCERSKIHQHHILPRELAKDNNQNNLIYLCPNCHNKVFIAQAKVGQHALPDKDSIIIIRKGLSTLGECLFFKYVNGEKEFVYIYASKEIVSL